VNVQFVASVAPITPDPVASRRLYVEVVGLPLDGDDYIHSENVPGSRHFGVWPLAQAAEACFGASEWPADRRVPQASIEFEVEDKDAVRAAEAELRDAGYEVLHPTRTEPWGQTVVRVLSPEGLIIGISYAPSMHSSSEAC
jgi:catechol 2,3-dioxygenase-like lactoylglutathione lyase family enzyme